MEWRENFLKYLLLSCVPQGHWQLTEWQLNRQVHRLWRQTVWIYSLYNLGQLTSMSLCFFIWNMHMITVHTSLVVMITLRITWVNACKPARPVLGTQKANKCFLLLLLVHTLNKHFWSIYYVLDIVQSTKVTKMKKKKKCQWNLRLAEDADKQTTV